MERLVLAADLQHVPVKESGEPLVAVQGDRLVPKQIGEDMRPITGNAIYVRESVAAKLSLIAAKLPEELLLEIVYGYRTPSIQQALFAQAMTRQPEGNGEGERIEAAHREIAYPPVAGHPTGGAVDVQLVKCGGTALDFGSPIWNFVPEAATFSSGMTKEQMTNRLVLREVMMAAGFAPFDGEWWHFSYGDREWAFYYQQPTALYAPIEQFASGSVPDAKTLNS